MAHISNFLLPLFLVLADIWDMVLGSLLLDPPSETETKITTKLPCYKHEECYLYMQHVSVMISLCVHHNVFKTLLLGSIA